MKTRISGKSGLEVSALGLDCIGLNFSYGHALGKSPEAMKANQTLIALLTSVAD